MTVLMVSSEAVPFSKSGGLADVAGSLSSALASLNNEVQVFMPLYGSINTRGFKKVAGYEIRMLGKNEKVSILAQSVNGVTYLALSHPLFTKRNGIYGDSSFTPYGDNFYRYMLMCKAAVAWAKENSVDIIHAHDWTAGPALYLAKEEGLKACCIYTIHNLAYMGLFARYDALRGAFRPTEKMLYGDGLAKTFNFLKTGIEYADMITTVSPTYAREIQQSEQGCGLDGLLSSKSKILKGVINGIDMNEWNPETDIFFSEHYCKDDLSGKAKLKKRIQKQFNLAVDPDIPLVAMISRLAEQKGFGPLLEGSSSALERILAEKRCQFIIIGTGDQRYEEKLKEIANKYDNISVNIVFSQALSHQVEGAADFFLMPSKYEPCGLNQMYSLRYGTLPIAHKTGGLADSIVDVKDSENGDGFLFENVYSDEIVEAVNRALDFYQNKEAFIKARQKGMSVDFSWNKSALEYERIYKNALGGNQL